MWNLHSLCVQYGRRPSEVLGLKDEWAAFQFDEAVVQFGLWIESKLAERDKQGAPKHTLANLLSEDKPQYASLAQFVTQRVQESVEGEAENAS